MNKSAYLIKLRSHDDFQSKHDETGASEILVAWIGHLYPCLNAEVTVPMLTFLFIDKNQRRFLIIGLT